MRGVGLFEPAPKLAIAISGGADSLCLAILANEWAKAREGQIRAFVVDHRLRSDSTAEAERVVAQLASMGIPAVILAWCHPPLARRIQEAARAARYALLEEAVADWGALHLLVGHHADDQAETIAMRTARHSGPFGLSGMGGVVERPGVRVVRPLLRFAKSRLTATLRARGVAWIEDPSNADPRFARTGFRTGGIGSPGPQAAASTRLALDEAAAAFLAARAAITGDRQVRFARADYRSLAEDVACHVLGRVLLALADRAYFPAPRARRRMHRALIGTSIGAMTLSGCLVRFGGRWVRILPEQPRPSPWRPPVPLCPAPFAADLA